jgi:hypothetical protein
MKRTLVVAHDAGGAEVVSAWVKKQSAGADYSFVLGGPATLIFRRKLGTINLICPSEMETSIGAADFVLTGTGYSSDLEKIAISSARVQRVPVASYLDHWMNYRARFELRGRFILPNEIWVGDSHAVTMAQEEFPDATVKFVENEYYLEMKEQIEAVARPLEESGHVHVLFVTEPTSVAAEKGHGDPRYWGYTEYEALDGYLSYLENTSTNVEVIVRPHPAEASGKYAAIIQKHQNPLSITESSGRTLVEDCAWADWVVGCDSMAMVIGVHARKQVYSCIPRGGPQLSLPYPEIVQLFNQNRCRSLQTAASL